MAKANSPRENVRALRHVLYGAAKRNRERKFPALLDRIARPDVLLVAWEQVRSNRGAAGIDGETLKAVVAYGVERMLAELGNLLLKKQPDFDARNYGFSKLLQLIKSFDNFEIDIRETGKKTGKLVYVREK